MRRREFIAALVTIVASPMASRAEQPTMPVIGFLNPGSPKPNATLVAAFRNGLSEAGYVEGKNVAIELLWAEGQYDRLPELVAGLVQRKAALILGGGPPSAHAAKAATTTIPIVFVSGDDPVKSGLVASLNRPGANITGVTIFTGQLMAKQLGLLRELLPKAIVVAILVNPNNPLSEAVIRDGQAAAALTGHQTKIVNASNEAELSKAFATLAELHADALVVGPDPYFFSRNEQLVALASHFAIPAIYELREFSVAGGLISYGASITDGYRQAGVYAGRILGGTKPADLPVLQPTRFELVINLKTAKALGISVPPTLLAQADEVIE